MINRQLLARLAAIVLVGSILAAGAFIGYQHFFGPTTIRAIFTSATGIYAGDGVRVAGVEVGTITAIRPGPKTVEITMTVDHSAPIPADAQAILVAQNLVAARYVQLTPPYESSGPTMPDGSVIPLQRTAVPVEWDQVKDQLSRLATDLGPQIAGSATPAARFIDSAANALGGNGDKLRQTLTELSGVGRILADGSGNIIDIIKNLQTFVTALRDSGEPIVQFEDRLASLSNVLDGSRSDLNAALTNLSVAVGEVQRFVSETRDKTSEQVQRLANVTQNLADHKQDLEQLLHVFPTSLVNFYNIFDPLSGTPNGSFAFNNFNNPVALFCSAMAAVDGNAMDGAKKCAEYLGPALRLGNPVSYFNINYLPFPINPILGPVPTPDQLIYSEPGLIPGGPGAQGLPPPPTVDEMLLPAERPPS